MVEDRQGLWGEDGLSRRLDVLSAGAAQGALTALAAREGYALHGDFGAVGAMRNKLLEGARCDLVVLTRALIDELAAAGRVQERADLGRVRTAVAVRAADRDPDVSTPAALRAALEAADEIYFPDPHKATAGIHFARVLDELGISGRRRTFANGATAMREMAASKARRVIGCTQLTEIRNTPGARAVAPLPAQFELATVYTAAVCASGEHAEDARTFLCKLAAEESGKIRREAGFEA